MQDELKLIELAKNGDEEARNQLIENNTGLIVSIAKKYCRNNSLFEDCLFEGKIALSLAIDSYDLEKKTPLSSFAYNRILKSILDVLGLNPNTSKKYMFFKKYLDNFAQDYSREPSYEELSSYIFENEDKHYDPEEIQEVLEGISSSSEYFKSTDKDIFVDSDEISEEIVEEDESVSINDEKESGQLSKSARCIKMLLILQDGRIHSLDELAREIKTKKRNVSVYRKEINSLGYDIKERRGPRGGYYLNKNNLFPVLEFSEAELNAFRNAHAFAMESKGFVNKEVTDQAFKKIFSSIKTGSKEKKDLPIIKSSSSEMMSFEEQESIYKQLEKAMQNRDEIEIEYGFVTMPKQKIIFHVYSIGSVDGRLQFEGLNVNANDFFFLYVNRVDKIRLTGRKFDRLEDVFKKWQRTFKSPNKSIRVTFFAYDNPARFLKTNKVGDDQIVEVISDDEIKATVTFNNYFNMFKFITGNNKHIKVIEPAEVIDDLKEYAQYVLDTYK